jgi:hypothetical protein
MPDDVIAFFEFVAKKLSRLSERWRRRKASRRPND